MINDSRLLLEAGRALHTQGRWQEAEEQYLAAAALVPGDPVIIQHIGLLCLDIGLAGEAARLFEIVVQTAPLLATGYLGLGNALVALGRPAEALTAFQKVECLDPENPVAWSGAGYALQALRRNSEGSRALEQAITLAPNILPYHYPLAMTSSFTEGDPRLEDLEALAAEEGQLPDAMIVDLHFALGKAHDDLGRYATAFEHYAKGNTIRRRHIKYDAERDRQMAVALARNFAPELFESGLVEGNNSTEPVFVVGMPRSGSCLVEQILASHPDIYCARESTILPQLLDEGCAGYDFPFDIGRLPKRAMVRLGSRYAAAVRNVAVDNGHSGAQRIVDKAHSNFRLVGLIRLALPNAKIIHVRRDPCDTCLSCYFSLFSQAANFAYDLSELGDYYSMYDELMAHWRNVLPSDAMLEIQYETLVEDIEGQTRRMLSFCGVDWDDSCLEFHRTKREAPTVSAVQRGQPVCRRSIGHWRHYAQFLDPLFTSLPSNANS